MEKEKQLIGILKSYRQDHNTLDEAIKRILLLFGVSGNEALRVALPSDEFAIKLIELGMIEQLAKTGATAEEVYNEWKQFNKARQ